MNTTEFKKLADAYADAVAAHRLESLYGTSKSYTLEKARERDEAHEALVAAIEAQGVPDGWQLVPKEPTEEMQAHAMSYVYVKGFTRGTGPAAVYAAMLASAPPAPQSKPIGWLYDWTHSSALGKPDEHFTSFTTDEEHARRNSNARQVFSDAQQAKQQPLSADRDAQVAELERELEKEKQYVKEMTKDRDHWMTVAAERALLLDKNRKVSKPLSDYEFDEIG